MAKRLADLYELGVGVEVLLGKVWVIGVVIKHEPPGMWVRTGNGRSWFVTNGRRVRKLENNAMKGGHIDEA